MTTGQQVIDRFAGRSDSAARRLAAWRSDPSKVSVVPVVEHHAVNVLYVQSPDDVLKVCKDTEHALGNVSKNAVSKVSAIRDWHPDFAFTHVLHLCVERTNQLPTYQGFRAFCQQDPLGRAALWDPATEMVNSVAEPSRSLARDAMRWRVGNAYYSFLREVYVLASLRALDLPVELHPLADALFRVDLWVADINVSLYIGNRTFRSGVTGRKERPEELLGDSQPAFRFHSIELRIQRQFGEVHLPSREHIEESAKKLAELADL